jgi:hypothetical protein
VSVQHISLHGAGSGVGNEFEMELIASNNHGSAAVRRAGAVAVTVTVVSIMAVGAFSVMRVAVGTAGIAAAYRETKNNTVESNNQFLHSKTKNGFRLVSNNRCP